jgi:hypothetical protein
MDLPFELVLIIQRNLRSKNIYTFASLTALISFTETDPYISIEQNDFYIERTYKGIKHSIDNLPASEFTELATQTSYITDTELSKMWYKNGLLHRIGGPAIEWLNGDKEWYENGQLHRIDGPAFESIDGHKQWYQNGELHRIDGPAIEQDDIQEWWVNGDKHRLDGPAAISSYRKEWWLNGVLQNIIYC